MTAMVDNNAVASGGVLSHPIAVSASEQKLPKLKWKKMATAELQKVTLDLSLKAEICCQF